MPGIGPLTAANIISELGDIREFSSCKKLASYVGIVPSVYSSADTYIATGSSRSARGTTCAGNKTCLFSLALRNRTTSVTTAMEVNLRLDQTKNCCGLLSL